MYQKRRSLGQKFQQRDDFGKKSVKGKLPPAISTRKNDVREDNRAYVGTQDMCTNERNTC